MNSIRPRSKIFLDGGDPEESRAIASLLGFLDGQTTNPTLIARHPAARARRESGGAFTKDELMVFYQTIARDIAVHIPNGSVSLEVYADAGTTAHEMMAQAREMYSWIPRCHIKFPITAQGLAAAERAASENMRVNMTLCFSQEQAAAVYAATRGAEKGQVFVSPFIGRLDDRGQNGMDLIARIIRMYAAGDGHVEVLAASIRSINHFLSAMRHGADIITAPAHILREWAGAGCPTPSDDWMYRPAGLTPIPYENINLSTDWRHFSIDHELTRRGVAQFSDDWNSLIKNNPSEYPGDDVASPGGVSASTLPT